MDLAAVKDRLNEAAREAFLDATAEHTRPPGSVSMSGLGGCTRANAYALAGVDPSDQPPLEEARQANLGTWLHDAILPRMGKRVDDARTNAPVMLRAAGLVLPGTLDMDTPDGVIDLKTVGEHRLHGVRRAGAPYQEHRVQVMGYAMARAQEGRPVRWVAWMYLDRATGELETMVEAFTNTTVTEVIGRAATIAAWAQRPDEAPRDARGPGLSFACDRCWWLKRCWGPTAEPGVRGAQTRARRRDDLGTVRLLELFDAASAARSSAEKDYEFAKAALGDAPSGLYGPWSLRRAKDGRPLVRLTEALAPKLRRGLEPVDED